MLENREHTASEQSIRCRARDVRDLLRALAIGAIPDDAARAGHGDIGNRQAIDVDADRSEIGGHQIGAEIGGSAALDRIVIPDSAINRARRVRGPVRRPKPLDTAAFLVDQHRRIAAQRIANGTSEAQELLGRFHVAGEKDHAPGLRFAEK